MSDGLEQVAEIVKWIWPFALWLAELNHRTKQTEKDVDHLYFLLRGGKGKRVRSLPARFARTKFEIRKRINGGKDTRKAT